MSNTMEYKGYVGSVEFGGVHVDIGGCGIVRSDNLGLSCDELREHGEPVA